MFIGEYSVQLGEKNRIAIPKKLREKMKGKTILTRGYERCLIIFDSERFDRFLDELNKRPLLSIDVRDTKRYILGGAQELEIDTQGRFVLSEGLKNFAKIEDKVVFLGVGEWIEMWNEEIWMSKLDDLSKSVSEIADRL